MNARADDDCGDTPLIDGDGGAVAVDLSMDVNRMIERLPGPLQVVARARMSQSEKDAMTATGLSRSQFRRQVSEIRRLFLEFGWEQTERDGLANRPSK